jgi:hypothetical protein
VTKPTLTVADIKACEEWLASSGAVSIEEYFAGQIELVLNQALVEFLSGAAYRTLPWYKKLWVNIKRFVS